VQNPGRDALQDRYAISDLQATPDCHTHRMGKVQGCADLRTRKEVSTEHHDTNNPQQKSQSDLARLKQVLLGAQKYARCQTGKN